MAENSFPDSLPGIQFGIGLDRIGGNLESYLRLLRKFRVNNRHITDDIDMLLENGDTAAALRLAHTLAGVSGNIGAEDLSRSARRLEAALREGDSGRWRFLSDEIASSLSLVLASIDSVTRDDQGAPAFGNKDVVIDVKSAIDQARKLQRSIEGYNAESMDIFLSLKGMLPDTRFLSELIEIETCIGKYDFDGAAEILHRLTDKVASLQTGP